MARYDNAHSRFVAIAKLILPLISLGLLMTLFLFGRDRTAEPNIPYAEVELETLAREQRVDAPDLSTVTEDGGKLNVTSTTVRPDITDTDVVTSDEIIGRLDMPNGSTVDWRADTGVMDSNSSIAEMSGDVVVTTSNGYTITSDFIAAQLDISRLESPGPVNGYGPLGTLTSGSMVMTQDQDTQDYIIIFNDGVKVVYTR